MDINQGWKQMFWCVPLNFLVKLHSTFPFSFTQGVKAKRWSWKLRLVHKQINLCRFHCWVLVYCLSILLYHQPQFTNIGTEKYGVQDQDYWDAKNRGLEKFKEFVLFVFPFLFSFRFQNNDFHCSLKASMTLHIVVGITLHEGG